MHQPQVERTFIRSAVMYTGKHSGRNALRTKLHTLGLDLSQDQLDDVFKRFKVSCSPTSMGVESFMRCLDSEF